GERLGVAGEVGRVDAAGRDAREDGGGEGGAAARDAAEDAHLVGGAGAAARHHEGEPAPGRLRRGLRGRRVGREVGGGRYRRAGGHGGGGAGAQAGGYGRPYAGRASRRRHARVQRLHERRARERLRDVAVEAGLEEALAVAGQRVRREGDGEDALVARERPRDAEDVDAGLLPAEVDVEDEGVEALAVHAAERREGVGDGADAVAPPEEAVEQCPGVLVVLDDEDGGADVDEGALFLGGRLRRGRRRGRLGQGVEVAGEGIERGVSAALGGRERREVQHGGVGIQGGGGTGGGRPGEGGRLVRGGARRLAREEDSRLRPRRPGLHDEGVGGKRLGLLGVG